MRRLISSPSIYSIVLEVANLNLFRKLPTQPVNKHRPGYMYLLLPSSGPNLRINEHVRVKVSPVQKRHEEERKGLRQRGRRKQDGGMGVRVSCRNSSCCWTSFPSKGMPREWMKAGEDRRAKGCCCQRRLQSLCCSCRFCFCFSVSGAAPAIPAPSDAPFPP